MGEPPDVPGCPFRALGVSASVDEGTWLGRGGRSPARWVMRFSPANSGGTLRWFVTILGGAESAHDPPDR